MEITTEKIINKFKNEYNYDSEYVKYSNLE